MDDLTLFETERLVLRGWRMDQVGDLVRLHGDPEVARYLSDDGAPWGEERARAAVAHWIELFETRRMGKMRLERKTDGVLVGRAGYGIHTTGEPEIGYALFREHQGNGYATEAATALRDWIFAATGHGHFIGMADTRNLPSLAILTGIGMTRTHVEARPGGSVQFHVYHRPAP